jgi:hypothetical protein
LYAVGTQKKGIEAAHAFGMAVSSGQQNVIFRDLATHLKRRLKEQAQIRAMGISIDNINKMFGVRDARTNHKHHIDNSTGGFAWPVASMPPGHKFIPREWWSKGQRTRLTELDMLPGCRAIVHQQKVKIEILVW